MPTYNYKCRDCGTELQKFQSIVDKPLAICPVCQGHLERQITGGSGLIFKGSGFYITDYKNAKSAGNNGNSGKKEKSK